MSKKYRLSLLSISTMVLIFVGKIITGGFSFLYSDFWFTSGLLLLVLLSLIDQPFFSKDSNIFVNATTAALSLLLIPQDKRNDAFWIFTIFTGYLVLSSYLLMWIRKSKLMEENKGVQFFSRLNRQLGKPEVLFSAFFLWGAINQFGTNSKEFNALLLFWAIFILLNIPSLAHSIENLFTWKKCKSYENMLGEIFCVQSKDTFLVRLLKERNVSVNIFDFVEFDHSIDKKKRKGIIVDIYLLNQEQWIKILCTREIEEICKYGYDNCIPDIVYKQYLPDDVEFLKRFVGIVSKNSTISKIKFLFNSQLEIYEGQMVELYVNHKKILYQIVQGTTKIENLENKNETSFIEGEAIQLGLWNNEKAHFEQFGWVPNINTPILLASSITEPSIGDNDFVIGNIPNTNYPVILNKDIAVTHHTAVFGITGAGKSVFVRNLIRQIASSDTKVIIVDLTGEYKNHFNGIKSIINDKESKEAFNFIEKLAIEKAKFLNQQCKPTIEGYENKIKLSFFKPISSFLTSDEDKSIFEIPDISNNTSILEYTKWFFWTLFQTIKTGDFSKKVCVVLEEAHTIVPEINALGVSDNASRATVNSIAQIALQGRKYGIGFIVIAQRTANVSKTVLTQCNTIIAFQSLDKTSGDFLSNYIGTDLIETLPTLKFRTAIAAGKAFRSTTPMIFEVPDIQEDLYNNENA